MRNSKEFFKKHLDSAASKIELNTKTMSDINKIKGSFSEEKISGGLADNKTIRDVVKKHFPKSKGEDLKNKTTQLKNQLSKGIKVEKEHTKNIEIAKEIALDHLMEDPKYYDKLKKIESNEATSSGSSGSYSQPLFRDPNHFVNKSNSETPKLKEQEDKVEAKEATTTASSGSYETPAMWAKSTKKKDWGPSRKPQIPGGSFVSIKKRCKTFPYCNQGDIRALNIFKNKKVNEVISKVSKEYNINENVVKAILEYELEKRNKLIYL